MIITNCPLRKNIKIFPHAKPSTYIDDPLWIKEDDEPILPVLIINKFLYLKNQEEDDVYSNFMQNLYENSSLLEDVVIEEDWESTRILLNGLHSIEETQNTIKIFQVEPNRTLKISTGLVAEHDKQLVEVLHRNISVFAWNYTGMVGVHPDIFQHHIFIKEGMLPVRQQQSRMNPTMKDIVKTKLQKLFDVGFISTLR